MKFTTAWRIEIYRAKNGAKPFQEWLESLKDSAGRYRIKERLDRVALGNLGDCKSIGGGVSELRLDFGPGYRIYFGKIGKKIILLLSGGDKSTQKKDIKRAIDYWNDYLSR
ncbi:MAG TPA: type II toxin-antitoxin system RelE/ParE family toxin [Gammaproteobacteria bacterium]|nr:type II toxin-antitoxin system RelE/ParE family toxin [Gammaproteobacteria bacterium]